MAFDRVFGEIVTSIPDPRLNEFSFWLVDSGTTSLSYRMGVGSTDVSGRVSSILFETEARTIDAGTAGAARQVTASTHGLVLDPSTYYFFYLLPTEPVTAPWGIQTTATNYGPGGRGGKMGLTQWNEDKFHNDILEMPFDRDFHFNAAFSDPNGPRGGPQAPVQSVPEPSVFALMALGGAAIVARRRRATDA